jgi:hypothetical protein
VFAECSPVFAGGVRDEIRGRRTCQKGHGTNDAKIGACFVKRERISPRQERLAWDTQPKRIARSQNAGCRKAIPRFRAATRTSAAANLRYLDTHRHSPLSEISLELNGQPFAALKTRTFAAKARAVRICG